MRKNSLFSLVSTLFCYTVISLIAVSASAAETTKAATKKKHREHKVHTHGAGTLDITIEKNVIKATLRLPAIDMIGFEGAPKTPEQKSAFDNLSKDLAKSYNMFLIDEAAGCTILKEKYFFDANYEEHGNYTLKMEYTCNDISKVTTLDVNVFRDMESVNNLTAQLVTDKTQKEVKLTRTNTKVEL